MFWMQSKETYIWYFIRSEKYSCLLHFLKDKLDTVLVVEKSFVMRNAKQKDLQGSSYSFINLNVPVLKSDSLVLTIFQLSKAFHVRMVPLQWPAFRRGVLLIWDYLGFHGVHFSNFLSYQNIWLSINVKVAEIKKLNCF